MSDGTTRPSVPLGAATGRGRLLRALDAAALIELVALCGIVFVQPVLDVLSKNATIFVTHDTDPLEALLFVSALALGPPLLLWLLEGLVGLTFPGARVRFHVGLLALLVGLFAVELLVRQVDTARRTAALLAVPAVVGASALFARFAPTRLWLRYLALATPAFIVLFLVFSPALDALFGDGPSSAAGVRVNNDARVVMVLLDELPVTSLLDGEGRVDAELFPNFAELANGSTWYRNHTTVAGYTQVAIPTILTGNYPDDPAPVANATTYPRSLFTLLGDSYEMNVHETATRLCPDRLCSATRPRTRGVRGLLDEAWNAWRQFAWPDPSTGSIDLAAGESVSEDKALTTGEAFVRSLRPGGGPRLDFLHLLMPHQPWHYLPSGQDYQQGGARGAPFYAWSNDYVARSAQQRHLLQLQTVDRLLGQIVDRLRALDAYEDSLVVVTADHGVAFVTDSSIRGVSPENYHHVAWTPLFIKEPGQTGAVVDDEPIQSIDILPTIADQLDAEVPWELHGRSALRARRSEGSRPFYRWNLNQIELPPGSDFVQLDGRSGFTRVLEARAAPADGDPSLRIYRSGPYGHLIGSATAPREQRGPPTAAALDHPDRYRTLDLRAPLAPWAYVSGTFEGAPGTPLAISANGRIVAFSESFDAGDGPLKFWAMVPPQLLQNGSNRVRLHIVRGDADDPRLEPVELSE